MNFVFEVLSEIVAPIVEPEPVVFATQTVAKTTLLIEFCVVLVVLLTVMNLAVVYNTWRKIRKTAMIEQSTCISASASASATIALLQARLSLVCAENAELVKISDSQYEKIKQLTFALLADDHHRDSICNSSSISNSSYSSYSHNKSSEDTVEAIEQERE